jgi:sugar phosphate isomerase/epimerase
MLHRRHFLATALGALQARAGQKFDRGRLSVLTDEIGTFDEAIAFAKQYKLKWLEVRAYRPKTAAELAEMKKKLDAAGLGVSFYNAALLKFTYPGTKPVKFEDFYENLYKKNGLTPEKLFAQREADLQGAIDSAKTLGVSKIRTFTYWRVADPSSLLPQLAETLQQMTAVAKKQGVELCVENEHSTNTGTTAETVALLKKVPGLKLNWDPQNSVSAGEKDVFPKGYHSLPKGVLANVQLKAEGLIGPGEPLDWQGIFRTLEDDGYSGNFGLETHTLKGAAINVPASHKCMQKMLELAGERSS